MKKRIGGDVKLKGYVCVQVGHHKDIGKTIEDMQRRGWRLHTYQVTGRDIWISHYLLFEKGE
jgi:hypothetical protein